VIDDDMRTSSQQRTEVHDTCHIPATSDNYDDYDTYEY
jgi:hypothetical protein